MKNSSVTDTVFTACASCTVMGVGTALVVLLYQIVTISVALVESSISAGAVWYRGF